MKLACVVVVIAVRLIHQKYGLALMKVPCWVSALVSRLTASMLPLPPRDCSIQYKGAGRQDKPTFSEEFGAIAAKYVSRAMSTLAIVQ
jgi:hypothetical protein